MDLTHFTQLARTENGLCVVSTLRPDHTIQASLVNVGVLPHPHTGAAVVGFVARGDAHKLTYLRTNPTITVVARADWDWATVEGTAEIIGPDDAPAGTRNGSPVTAEELRLLLREVFTAAGGEHDDWDVFDRVMAAERRVAVLVTPVRCYTNG
jgi:PPOX class probable F420-dependent enzyme